MPPLHETKRRPYEETAEDDMDGSPVYQQVRLCLFLLFSLLL